MWDTTCTVEEFGVRLMTIFSGRQEVRCRCFARWLFYSRAGGPTNNSCGRVVCLASRSDRSDLVWWSNIALVQH